MAIDINTRMPVLFIGHGSPMNAIEDNKYTREWAVTASRIPKPRAVLVVSAHWVTGGTRVMEHHAPGMIYDMYGFPEELYRVVYPANGSPELAREAANMITRRVAADSSRGYDHGAWLVLRKMYPAADVPVFQLSLDGNAGAEDHFRMGRELSSLREKNVLILGSGNIVHNLSRIAWNMDGGLPWADAFDAYIKDKASGRQYDDIIHYELAGKMAELAFYTTEHFDPLLYVLGASRDADSLTVFNDARVLGSLSMTCYLFQ